jgi:hypothetical protein
MFLFHLSEGYNFLNFAKVANFNPPAQMVATKLGRNFDSKGSIIGAMTFSK